MGSIGEIAFVGEQGGCSKLSLWLISLPSILAHGSDRALASMLLCVCVALCNCSLVSLRPHPPFALM